MRRAIRVDSGVAGMDDVVNRFMAFSVSWVQG